MQLNQDSIDGNRINAYQAGEIIINRQVYTNSMIITRDRIETWQVDAFENLNNNHFDPIIKKQANIFIFGVGERLQFPRAQLLTDVHAAQIGIEIMDNAAACRTYNVLASENRKVVLALIIGN